MIRILAPCNQQLREPTSDFLFLEPGAMSGSHSHTHIDTQGGMAHTLAFSGDTFPFRIDSPHDVHKDRLSFPQHSKRTAGLRAGCEASGRLSFAQEKREAKECRISLCLLVQVSLSVCSDCCLKLDYITREKRRTGLFWPTNGNIWTLFSLCVYGLSFKSISRYAAFRRFSIRYAV